MDKISGIYQIQSRIKPERIYIGSSVNINERWSHHTSDLRLNNHKSLKLQNHYNKYGKLDLRYSILLSCDIEDLLKIEQYFMDLYNPYFNICKIAGNAMLGRHHSEESKLKMSKSHIGLLSGKNHPMYGKHTISWCTGKHLSEETKKKISQSKKGCSAWNKGKPMSEESKKKVSIGNKGKQISAETRLKISLFQKGRPNSAESIRKQKETRLKNKIKKSLLNKNLFN